MLPSRACFVTGRTPFANAHEMKGSVVLMTRGTVSFAYKVGCLRIEIKPARVLSHIALPR